MNELSSQNFAIRGPFCDIATQNLVLSIMDIDYETQEEQKTKYSELEEKIISPNNSRIPIHERVIAGLEKEGNVFTHTKEYYAAIKEAKERMNAYKTLAISYTRRERSEILEHPFKFLELPDSVSFGELRNRWITLANLWNPDRMFPERKEEFDLIFNETKFPLDYNKNEWYIKIKELIAPVVLTTKKVTEMNEPEREEYIKHMELFKKIEHEYERVKNAMTIHATRKRQDIQQAYDEAKKQYSQKEQNSFAGFDWVEIKLSESEEINKYFPTEALRLEGDGEIRRSTKNLFSGYVETKTPHLYFDYGGIRENYISGFGYAQSILLKSFFAWTELVQGKDLCPNLLSDIVKECQLNSDQSEQLRMMIMNKEDTLFILETLGIIAVDKNKLNDSNIMNFKRADNLKRFIYDARNGPKYEQRDNFAFYWASHNDDFEAMSNATRYYTIGIEFTPKNALILKYTSNHEEINSITHNSTAYFTPIDVNIMLALAYGNMIAEK